MKDDDISYSVDTNAKDDSNKETSGKASPSPKGVTPKPRSSGRGLRITAIVLGIIIVLLLALYIFLTLTYKKPAHSSVIPTPAITLISQISKS